MSAKLSTLFNSPSLQETLQFIQEAHAGEMYGERPFWNHPHEVMMALPMDAPEEVKHAALLHDVIEDTPFTAKDLLAKGYSVRVVSLVEALSRPEPERVTYMNWIREIADSGDIWLVRIKLADNKCNLASLDSRHEFHHELGKRYQRSMKILMKAEHKLASQS